MIVDHFGTDQDMMIVEADPIVNVGVATMAPIEVHLIMVGGIIEAEEEEDVMMMVLLRVVDLEVMTGTMIVHPCVDPVGDGEKIKALIVSTIIVEGHPVEAVLVVLQCIGNQGVGESTWMAETEIIIGAEN